MSNFEHLCGWEDRPKAVEAVMSELPFPVFYDEYGPLKDSGKGKIQLLYECVRAVAGEFPIFLQTEGDCQNPSALVRMGDGSEKMIKDIIVGDSVITPYGNIRKVLNTIKKPYNKKMVKIEVAGYNRTIESTPDHLYMNLPNIGRKSKNIHGSKSEIAWKPIVGLNEGDFVLIPKLPNLDNEITFDLNDLYDDSITESSDYQLLRTAKVDHDKIRAKASPNQVNRFIKLDEKLSWLIGLYAAEGSKKYTRERNRPCSIVYNLCHDEIIFANKVKQYLKEIFGIDARIHQVKSKPTVLFVSFSNTLIATLFMKLCSGNTYTKKINDLFLTTSFVNKLGLLSGWSDGDGYHHTQGTSVSESLIHDMFNIANSLGMNPRISVRPAYKQSKQAYNVHFNGGCELLTSQDVSLKITGRYVTEVGKAAKITKIEMVEPETEFVYCIEVEEDHSFICNGYGIHNCVSMGAAQAVNVLKAVEIIVKGEMEEWAGSTSTEDIYGGSRVLIGNGQLGYGAGSIGGWASRYVSTYGTLIRKKYGDIDLSVYNGRRAVEWGNPNVGPPRELLPFAKEHVVKTVSQIRSYEECRDSIFNGFPVTVASSQGFSTTRDKDGFASPMNTWNHQLMVAGMDDAFYRPGVLIVNSWGLTWNNGPKRHNQMDGTFWCDAEVIDRMLKAGDSWAYSNFDGFKPQTIDLKIV